MGLLQNGYQVAGIAKPTDVKPLQAHRVLVWTDTVQRSETVRP